MTSRSVEIESCIYRIFEGTKNELVAVGSDGKVRRWGQTHGDEQEWVIVPCGDNRFQFLTCQNGYHQKGEVMAVGSNGDIVRWGPTGGKEQIFSFSTVNPDGWVQILEHTKNENVAIGSDGRALRWAANGGKEQLFKLEPGRRGTPPELSKDPRYEPGRIPFPTLPDEKPPADPPKSYLISETLEPAFFVKDSRYRSKVQQVLDHPYYRLRREQRWQPVFFKTFDGRSSETHTERVKVGMSVESSTSMETTIGLAMNADYGMSFAPELEVKGLKIKGQSFDGSFGYRMTTELKMKQSTVTQRLLEREVTVTVEVPAGKRFSRAIFVLVDFFQVIDRHGRVEGQWEVRHENHVVQLSFPPIA